MMTYTVKTASGAAGLDCAEELRLENFYLDRGYHPRTAARLVYVPGEGLYCRMECAETSPRAVITETDGDTYKDSCMEWFINCAPEKGDMYLNFEGNSIGTLHCKLGKDRYVRNALADGVPRPRVRSEVRDAGWSVEYLLPDETIKAVFGRDGLKSGDVLTSNFYKCGDETDCPHYESWSPVLVQPLDFHSPDFFGRLIIE